MCLFKIKKQTQNILPCNTSSIIVLVLLFRCLVVSNSMSRCRNMVGRDTYKFSMYQTIHVQVSYLHSSKVYAITVNKL